MKGSKKKSFTRIDTPRRAGLDGEESSVLAETVAFSDERFEVMQYLTDRPEPA